VVNEAMACGLSLILNCNVNSGRDYLKHNYNGLFFDNSAMSLAKQMMFYIKNKNKIILFGKRNYKIFLKSKMNSKNAVKFFLSKIF
jgi:glycosyltransferase involved in cell wall biosynthesis